ncbi:CHC2 zinc finger domain-containing protein [Dorea sp. YH-dor228]|uniref:CHC2 zinc finger domain-containing protein n=1 Tax=Dorea sp. YH-dor228 TaxID=3151120 RepID=UPI003242C69B
MGLFEEVKKNVTVRQAAEFYGFKPNRSGLIRCIFHKDNTPSMKVDRRYYCFGCGCTGDAVDFTAQLFGLGAREAAVKLAADFGISYGGKSRDSPERKKKVSITNPEVIQTRQQKDEWIRLVRAYLDYRSMLLDWKKQYAPKNPKEEWNEQFEEALRELTYVEYVLDILLFGEKHEKDHMVQEKRKKVEDIERKCDEYVRRK